MRTSTMTRMLGAASLLAFADGAAIGQVAPPPEAGPAASAAGDADIVVTGTSTRQRKFDAPYSVTSIDAAQIADAAPHSVADLLAATPGITVEASGGEGGGENVVIRGLPWSGWRLIDFNQDGMPLFESNTERFMNIDQFYRVDLDTQRVEVVRGGTAPLFSNNAPGGVVNFITNHGTDTYRGTLRLESGTGNRARTDIAVSGPLSERLMVSVSGFYRRDDGLRDPGYDNADRGGQFKLGATYKLDGGRIWGDVKYLNDRSIFYTALPLADPVTGASLEGLIDPRDGTLSSAAFRRVTLRTLGQDGRPTTIRRDLADGIHPDVWTGTLGADHELGAGFAVAATYRHMEGTTGFDTILNGAPVTAASFLAGRLAGARSGFGSGVTSLRYVVAGTNTVYDPATTGNLVMANTWASIRTRTRYDAGDIRLTKTLETPIGRHSLTGGLYYSDYRYAQEQSLNSLLVNVRSRPIALDVQALNAAGRVLGNVTENGFVNYGAGGQSGSLDGRSFAFYLADSWQVTPAWSIDAGVRRVSRDQDGVQGVLGTVNADPTGSLAARNVQGVVRTVERSEDLKGTSWTIGSGYVFSRNANVFGRYTRSFSYPRFDTILGGATLPGSTEPLPVAKVQQAEAGFKFATPGLRLTTTGFWSRFDRLNGGTQVAAADGTISNANIIFDTRTYGVEVEAVVSPFAGFDVSAVGMWQDPKIVRVDTLTGVDAQSSKGGEITRVPRVQLTVQPSYAFVVGDAKARLYGTFFTIGRRFQDASNLSRLPAYSSVDLGASIEVDGLELRGSVSNVFDVVGLTEGNSRAAVIGSGTGVLDATVGRSIFGRNFTVALTKRW